MHMQVATPSGTGTDHECTTTRNGVEDLSPNDVYSNKIIVGTNVGGNLSLNLL